MSSREKMLIPIRLEEAAVDLLNHLVKLKEEAKISLFIPLILIAWAIHRWFFSFSNWLPLALALWGSIQYGNYQRKLLEEDLNKKWNRIILNTSPMTPVEHCEWLNLLSTQIWSNYFNPRLSRRLSNIVEKRLKLRKPRFIEKVEVQEFSLGSCPPSLGLQGMRWSTSGGQRVLKMGFDWDTSEMSILMLAKLSVGTAKILINSLHIKGDLLVTPILDGKALLYSFLSTPEVGIGVAFGSGGSQSATELPGVSPWLKKLFTDTLVKTMVEPRRRCFTLPVVNLRKTAVGGIIYVSVISANKLSRSYFRRNSSWMQENGIVNGCSENNMDDRNLQTFVEVEVEELTRRTGVSSGSTPKWDETFNMVLHDNTGIVRFNLYESPPSGVKFDYLASCEIKMRHVEDDSTIMWAIGKDSGVIAKHAKFCGDEVEMVVPFEGTNSAELKVKIVVKEWQFSDGSHSLNNLHASSRQSLIGSSNLLSKTGRKLKITVVEAKDLAARDKFGKFEPYIKLQYGKVVKRTHVAPHPTTPNPVWNHLFEFDENDGDEYLNVKCFSEEIFGDENMGSARVNLEGLEDGSIKDVWIPLEGVSSGELRLKIEVVKVEDLEGSKDSAHGWIELVLIEARDLVAADRGGTSDPYVRVNYGNLKKRTKVIHKTLNPRWNQTLEFLDDGSPLTLHVKDHNALLPTSSIGVCVVEYQRFPPNQMSDKWIPLQGVKSGEIHIQITRKIPEMQTRHEQDSDPSLSKSHQIPSQIREMMKKFRSLIEDGNLEGLSTTLSELETLEDTKEGYIAQLETEQMLLLSKINELGQEMVNSSSSLTSSSSQSGN
ncbi:synaptotagmin-4-like isoform X2 [Abrus precatorius]|uniref:Synaptotagmin-4-like isoform X2 n=1 Tax=Abrus precatorius TaxID=3816 RepID=A0A8B8KAW9_ABRPR|nr:synaptotagmin-4-like isoform X2 [Abrus precatorius]